MEEADQGAGARGRSSAGSSWASAPASASGCNVGAFFARVAMGDASGWLFGFGMIGGAYIGVKFFNWWTERKMAKEMEIHRYGTSKRRR